MTSADMIEPEPSQISGFWHRLFAFLLDTLILGIVGAGLGFLLYDSLSAIGGLESSASASRLPTLA